MSTETCSCGHDRKNVQVQREASYSVLGYLLLMMGTTPTPTAYTFHCRKCGESLGTERDPQEIKRLMRDSNHA